MLLATIYINFHKQNYLQLNSNTRRQIYIQRKVVAIADLKSFSNGLDAGLLNTSMATFSWTLGKNTIIPFALFIISTLPRFQRTRSNDEFFLK